MEKFKNYFTDLDKCSLEVIYHVVGQYDVRESQWDDISENPNLTEEFINDYCDKLNMSHISRYQKLSEPFIDLHASYLNWRYICRYQKMSEKFIKDHAMFIRSNMLIAIEFQDLSEGFKRQYI